jgi:hypothetical protein
MANANTPTGIRPVNQNGTPWNGQGRLCNVPASQTGNIFLGDPVVFLGATDAYGCPQVGIATAGSANPVLGSMLSISNGPAGSGFTVTRDLPVYRQASISNYILIVDDPNCLFEVQEDSSGGAIPAATSAGENGNLVSGAGSTVTGYSGWMLQSSSVGSGANSTKQLRLLGLVRGPDNAIGNYAKWLVRLNTAQLWSASGV